MADDLHAPLGHRPLRRQLKRQLLLVGFSGLLIVMAMAGGWLWQRSGSDLPPGAVVARIEPAPPPPPAPPAPPAEPEQHSEVEVVRQPGTSPGTGVFIKVPQDVPSGLRPAPDPLLAEKSRFGILPQRGRDGTRPMDAYAHALQFAPGLPANAPRVALVFGGLGPDAALSANASMALPNAVTLGFTTDGSNLERRVQDARAAGHEVVLQLSMDAPTARAGAATAHVLTADLDQTEALDRLHWQMSRFTGYVGVATAPGAAFTATDPAAGPVLGDLARRGLFVVDDGTSSRSAVPSLAAAADLPLVRVDLVLSGADDGRTDAALAKFEQRARDRGYAVGLVTGGTASLGRTSVYAQKLADRGLALVPVSAIAVMQAGRADPQARQ